MNQSILNSNQKFKAVIDHSIIIEMEKVKQQYYVSFKPGDQVKQLSKHLTIQKAYNQIISFVMGYLTGHMQKSNIDYVELKRIINNIQKTFKINIVFGIF